MYKVIVRFMDLEDNNFIYEEGWDFPRANHFVKEARIQELASADNKQGKPLIEKVGEVKDEPIEEKPVEPIEEPKLDEIVEEVVEEEIKKEAKPKKARKKKE